MTANGFLVLDKPPGVTSRDVVDLAAKWFPRRAKIGHAGTLDPLATGVLVVAVGHATRLIEYVQAMPKVYRARVVFGGRSTTDDADGAIALTRDAVAVSDDALNVALGAFRGEVEQVPPDFSAARVDGKRAYDLARRGREVAIAPRQVRVDRIDVLEYVWPNLDVEILCGKGTYIRSIARDLGDVLGVGGYIASLRRTHIGTFTTAEALPTNANITMARSLLLPPSAAVRHFPSFRLTEDEIRRVRMGQALPTDGMDGDAAALDAAGGLIAVGWINEGKFKPDKVIPAELGKGSRIEEPSA